ncbi:MAG: J domain-containing protein [Clostridia bacterium]|nr:J domain-containing protein [Clostridia bacterium]
MNNPYKVLGISADATDTEVKNAYRALARKYHPDNYTADNPLADLATEKMKEINEAYDQIMKERAASSSSSSHNGQGATTYANIRQMLNARRFREAAAALSAIPVEDRVADWHYLQSIVLMQRGFVNDAARELEIACTMEPGNQEYQEAKRMFNQSAQGFGAGSPYGQTVYHQRRSDGCDLCFGLLWADCCCECLGGDLISCC